ncbi:hypothetical protein M885DRAFT_539790 [Pelagophyceae sp. CCMP2097]|nr:hypothetical protein M885DRAFT_539790 [Pelagophyceae sp. CCMP2097]
MGRLALWWCAVAAGLRGAEAAAANFLSSFLRPADAVFDQYAAALAVTEPLRNERDARIRKALGPVRWFFVSRRQNVCDPEICASCSRCRQACVQHNLAAAKALATIDVSIKDFNKFSRVVANDDALRGRVLRQAHAYRLRALVDGARRDVFIVDEADLLRAPVPDVTLATDELLAFAAVAQKVEALRQQKRAALVRSYDVDAFPDLPICDPRVLPLLSDDVRAYCADFPARAAELVERNGLDFGKFDALLKKAERNPFFRWRLGRAMRKL